MQAALLFAQGGLLLFFEAYFGIGGVEEFGNSLALSCQPALFKRARKDIASARNEGVGPRDGRQDRLLRTLVSLNLASDPKEPS